MSLPRSQALLQEICTKAGAKKDFETRRKLRESAGGTPARGATLTATSKRNSQEVASKWEQGQEDAVRGTKDEGAPPSAKWDIAVGLRSPVSQEWRRQKLDCVTQWAEWKCRRCWAALAFLSQEVQRTSVWHHESDFFFFFKSNR